MSVTEMWLYLGSSMALALLGAAALVWSLFSDRSRGRKRCPKCWYAMEAAPSLRCPECGYDARSAQRLYKTRRRWKWSLASVIVVLVAAYLAIQPKVQPYGYASLTPKTVLIFLLHFNDSEWISGGISYHLTYDLFHRYRASSYLDPADPGRANAMWRWQWRWLGRIALERVRELEQDPAMRVQYMQWLTWCREFSGDDELRQAIIEQFIQGISHDDPQVRRLSTMYAIDLEDIDGSIEHLVLLLDSGDENVIHGAVLGLRSIALRSMKGVEMLIAALEHDHARVRSGATFALCRLAEENAELPGAYEAVFALKDDPDCDVRTLRICLLVALQDRDNRWETVQSAIRSDDACVRLGGVLATTRRSLPLPDPGPTPESVMAMVIDALNDEDEDVRAAAQVSLYAARRYRAIDLVPHIASLEALLDHEDIEVQAAVTDVLERIAPERLPTQ